MKIERKDHKIMDLLRKNSRLSIRQIAKKTSIRPSTVHLRIQRLVKGGIIEKFTVKLNNKAYGEGFIAFLLITTRQDIPTTFLQNKHIKEVFGITGEYDLILKLKFKDVDEFNHFIINLRKYPSLQKSLTMVVTMTIKEEM